MSTTETKAEELVNKLTEKTATLKLEVDVSKRVAGGFEGSYVEALPPTTRARYERHGINLSQGYPEKPPSDRIPLYVDDAHKVRDKVQDYIPRGKNADPEKKALFKKVKQVKHLTKHIGTELIGVQLSDLNEQELDELALLIAERVVVFFRDQDLSPQKQLKIGEFFGNVEVHPQVPHVPDLPGTTVIWNELARRNGLNVSWKNAKAGTGTWHSDLPHERQPPGITHLHNDAIPEIGGDTLWASGYAAYDKLSPAFQKFLEGKVAVQRSMHTYLDRENPLNGGAQILREQPIVRTHPVTGWKSLYVNRDWTVSIKGLEPDESKLILNYLYDVYEKNLDIQVRFNWKPTDPNLGTSALWDNRVSQHAAVWDYGGEEPRHGTRVTSLAEVPYFDPESKSQREALGLTK
ncbi:Alpha-ketoglutarate-dependent taurine dioxygenase [Wickerhamomyces ciferrii]|uniref:Alpha-ketoglutarate-dependent taurine dioxygenase n=1 Tax=Wickerhamomyces ciferrii (strain ATCC 14091 / BCRC 22168 / CBS 111 / JCM 3599 / NBRC 0793 / NRRL Y-1031 F-60-10) TaxID=1206466 RepID=K0KGA4_WICCF|nr:Alpha-ketoglutarate-dependent taurine dioxygenase [Wickerhamomyces ciferrii]CCH44190.1 Alpha-ketoglutarate-dependent taurine dioxygenase [Wickerhamomyces ciferrii]